MSDTGARGPGGSEKAGWWTYDSIAETYDRVFAPILAGPAVELVKAVAPHRGARVLDLGTGTGVAARAAMEVVGPHGLVVGLDPSPEMLRLAREKGVALLALGVGTGLPFRDGAFEAVVANFVISHLHPLESALREMVRVLAPGGRLGVTAWGPRTNPYVQTWRGVAGAFVPGDEVDRVTREILPNEERFSEPEHLCVALREAGLERVHAGSIECPVRISAEEYLAGREITVSGRFLHDRLDPAAWSVFRNRVWREFRRQFPERLEYVDPVVLGAGVRPR